MKIYKILIVLLFSVVVFSCQDELDTNPTDSTSGDVLFSDVEKAVITSYSIHYTKLYD